MTRAAPASAARAAPEPRDARPRPRLCPSSWIAAAPDRVATENDQQILHHVEESISALFRQADALACRVVRRPRVPPEVARSARAREPEAFFFRVRPARRRR